MVLQHTSIGFRFNKNDLEELKRTFTQLGKSVRAIGRLPGKLVRDGQNYAKSIAPHDTGTLIKAIETTQLNQWSAQLWVDPVVLATNPKLTKENKHFNYAEYMHETRGVMGRGWSKNPIMIKSGDPNFMDATSNYLWSKFGTESENKFKL